MSYDEKYRKRVIEYLEKGHTYRGTSEIFGISPNTLATWKKKLKETGCLVDTPRQNKPKKIVPEELEKYLEDHPDAYQREIAQYFFCSQTAVYRRLKNMKITRKKRLSATKNKTQRK